MSDHYLPFVYFAVLAPIAVIAAICAHNLGRSGLKAVFASAWALLIVGWIVFAPEWYLTVADVLGISVIFAFALLLVYLPMLIAIEGKSLNKLLMLGIVGSAVSAVASLYFGVFVACLLGDCL